MLRTRVFSAGLVLAIGLGGASAALAPAALAAAAGPAAARPAAARPAAARPVAARSVAARSVAARSAAAGAAAARPAATGSFRTWHAAQQAAGFRLRRPTRTHGLARAGRIFVTRCEVTGELRKRNVFASWGHVQHRFLEISQNNSGGPCGNFGEAKELRKVRVHGARATLFGVCGFHGAPSCHKRNIFLFLTWKKHHVFYVATSHDERGHVLVNFARSLRRVR